MLPEYQFDHCVYTITESNLTEEGLVYGYNKCAGFLKLKQRPDIGLTVIIAQKWMFAAILAQPYTKNSNGHPVFLDGFSFAGLVSLQTVSSVWPATAGLHNDEISILEAFEKSTYIAPVTADPEEEMTGTGGDEEAEGAQSSVRGGESSKSPNAAVDQ